MNLGSTINSIPRISPIYQKRLNKLGIKTIRDLFYHFPFRYDDFSNIKPIADLKIGETVTVQGRIVEIKNIRTWKKRMNITEAHIQDETGVIKAVWFNQPYLLNTLKQDDIVSLAGKVGIDKELYLSNPAYEKIFPSSPQTRGGLPARNDKRSVSGGRWGDEIHNITTPNPSSTEEGRKILLRHTGGLIPIYPETTGLSSRWLRYILKPLLPKFLLQIKDHLPIEIKRAQGLLDLNKAIEQIHFPKSQKHANEARRRLAFDELFFIQLHTLQQKAKWQSQAAPKIKFNKPLIKDFVQSLPFKLTDAQRRSAWEILQDLEKPKPMNRLLEGDVGSGKTVVAAIGALQTVNAGYQVAFMAPTEILAQQHYKTITELLKDQNITIGLLTSSEAVINNISVSSPQTCATPTASARRARGGLRWGDEIHNITTPNPSSTEEGRKISIKKSNLLQLVSSSQIQILIGTHALIQENVQFKNLALVIVDEQHRFGVAQRAALQNSVKKIEDGSIQTIPHLLSMTATPIPRTLALTIYGDLDISLLDEMPKNRKEIITKIVAPAQRQQAYEFIQQQVKAGRQVFVICPRIEISDKSHATSEQGNNNAPDLSPVTGHVSAWDEVKAVKQEYEKLDKIVFPDLKILMLHGKMKPREKEKIMQDFRAKKADILVSTSVVEVGVDIPNATMMMIEGAERFGLAQLHQFRGRVGRGEYQSYCLLFTTSGSDNARLRALVKCKNGFELAEKDLALRGPGEFFGTAQSGLPDLSMASLSDMALVKSVREEAQKLIQKDPELKSNPALAEKLKQFQTTLHLE